MQTKPGLPQFQIGQRVKIPIVRLSGIHSENDFQFGKICSLSYNAVGVMHADGIRRDYPIENVLAA